MKLVIKGILIILLLLRFFVHLAYGADDSNYDWMNTNINSLGSVIPQCIEPPAFNSMNQSSAVLNVENDGEWVPTSINVQQGKLLSMSWNTKGILPRPKKFRLLYRIDPRFKNPQIFIQEYDYNQKKYISDFSKYKGGNLLFYQSRPEIFSTQRINDLNDYFNFNGRARIPIQKGDVINIVLNNNGGFISDTGDMVGGSTDPNNLLSIFTDSVGINNKILYSSATRWCEDIVKSNGTTDNNYSLKCQFYPGKYIDFYDPWSTLVGRPSEPGFTSKIISIPSCPANAVGMNNNPACFYDKGRGFNVEVGNKIIKDSTQSFIYSPVTGKYFLYYYSDAAGDLNFTTSWLITGMYNNLLQEMNGWKQFTESTSITDFFFGNSFISYMNIANYSAPINFFHVGVYNMEIEVGAGNPVTTDNNSIKVQYAISNSAVLDSSSASYPASQDFKNDAYASGYLWLKVVGGAGKVGNIKVNIANYTGSNWFSSVVYGSLVKPLRDKYNELSKIIYQKLVINPTLQNIGRVALILYIIIYGLVFLAGAVQITVTDLVVRVLKVGVIVALFSKTSWSFFNDNLFNVFVSGSDYLLTTVVGVTSSAGNIFGFIDPIFDKYTQGNVWALLGIQLLQIHNGLTFFAILTIYSILIYFRAVLEVIISYCLAFLGIAVMISLAPFFIIMMLFERTKSMFDNWISTLFSYMVQPTILLVFFLLIDQMMSAHIAGCIVKACWGTLIPLKIGIDLSNIGIPISFSFSLPFLPGIPFYIPQVNGISSTTDFFGGNGTFMRIATSAFIFYIYCKLAAGLIEYVTIIVQSLTNVVAARQDGKLQGSINPVQDIMSDMKKLTGPATGAAKAVGSFVKEKAIDQKITHRDKTKAEEPDYSKIRKKDEGGGDAPDKASKGKKIT